MYDAYVQNDGRLPYRHLENIHKEGKPDNEWITRNILNKAFRKYRLEMDKKTESKPPSESDNALPHNIQLKQSGSLLSDLSNVSSTGPSKSKSVGRPVGKTFLKKKADESNLIAAKNEIAKKYCALKETATKKGTRVKAGTLNEIIQSVKHARGINNKISCAAIRRCCDRQRLVSHHVAGGRVSPMVRIEPIVVEIILQMARLRQCLCPSKGLQLVNSLIKGTEIQKELIDWKKKNTLNTNGTLGTGYWPNFLKRNKAKIVSKRGQKY